MITIQDAAEILDLSVETVKYLISVDRFKVVIDNKLSREEVEQVRKEIDSFMWEYYG